MEGDILMYRELNMLNGKIDVLLRLLAIQNEISFLAMPVDKMTPEVREYVEDLRLNNLKLLKRYNNA